MIKKLLVLFTFFAFSVTGLAQKPSLAPDLQSLVDAERAFARTATEKGVRDSFLAFIADDGILYRPGPVNGKQWLTARPARPGLLTWQPTYADISAAGDMGITTGPWEFREKGPEDPPIGFGQFATVWKKQPDGAWKFVIDIGIDHEKPDAPAVPWQLPSNFKRKKVTGKASVDAEWAMLLFADADFSKAARVHGAARAYKDFAADDIRFLRSGSFPIISKTATLAVLAKKPGAISWEPVSGGVSASEDLGYTYGSYKFTRAGSDDATENGSYMRIWKKNSNGEWKVVLDIFNEHPKPA